MYRYEIEKDFGLMACVLPNNKVIVISEGSPLRIFICEMKMNGKCTQYNFSHKTNTHEKVFEGKVSQHYEISIVIEDLIKMFNYERPAFM